MSDLVSLKKFARENGISYENALRYYYGRSRSGSGQMGKYVIPRRNEYMYKDLYNAGALIGGYLGGDEVPPKGALAALLSGLNATIKVD